MDAMLDLETWGVRPGASLRSVGLVTFVLGRPAEGGERFYSNICRESCKQRGLREEQGTVDWWARQSRQAQDALEVNPRSLVDVVIMVEQWLYARQVRYVWCQGANFDAVLWEAACRAVGRDPPWRFYNVRDTRTLYDAGGLDPRSIARDGTYHNAVDDAAHQVACVQAAYRMLHNSAHMELRWARIAGVPVPRPGGERLVRGGYSAPGDRSGPPVPTTGSGVLPAQSVARAGIEAQHGLNDVWPGDEYKK